MEGRSLSYSLPDWQRAIFLLLVTHLDFYFQSVRNNIKHLLSHSPQKHGSSLNPLHRRRSAYGRFLSQIRSGAQRLKPLAWSHTAHEQRAMKHTQVCVAPLPQQTAHSTLPACFFSNSTITYIKAWTIKSNCMAKSARPLHTHTHLLVPQLIQRTSFLTCIFHFAFSTTPLPLTDTAQSRGASDIGSGNLSCDPELLTECLIFIAT